MPVTSTSMVWPASLRSDRDRHHIGIKSEISDHLLRNQQPAARRSRVGTECAAILYSGSLLSAVPPREAQVKMTLRQRHRNCHVLTAAFDRTLFTLRQIDSGQRSTKMDFSGGSSNIFGRAKDSSIRGILVARG